MNPQSRFAFSPELIVDLFAGAGGASEGIRQAFGRDPDIAINHDSVAVSMHEANHPGTRHYVSDVFEVDPVVATAQWADPMATTGQLSWPPPGRFHDRLRAETNVP